MQLFVFPLSNGVFFPATSKPLNVFEPRYLQMVEDSLRTGTPIALGFVEKPDEDYMVKQGEPLSFVRPVAGYGKAIVAEKRPDGTFLIFLQAIGKARLGPLQKTDTPYLVVEAEAIPESEDLSPSQAVQLVTLQKLLANWVMKNIPEEGIRNQFLGQMKAPMEIISSCASFLLQDPDLQQAILEEDSLSGKINLLMGLLASGRSI